MPTGKVMSFKDDRGYGFITPEDGGSNIYLHISALQQSGIEKIAVGDEVSYELHSDGDKISAINIKKIS